MKVPGGYPRPWKVIEVLYVIIQEAYPKIQAEAKLQQRSTFSRDLFGGTVPYSYFRDLFGVPVPGIRSSNYFGSSVPCFLFQESFFVKLFHVSIPGIFFVKLS